MSFEAETFEFVTSASQRRLYSLRSLDNLLKEVKAKIKCEEMEIWQKEWESEIKAKHYHINQSNVGGKRINMTNRREEVVYSRLRLGHT